MSAKSSSKNIPNRPDKTIEWLGRSRDEWKNKTLRSKAALKVSKQAQKRAQEGRAHWKEQFCQVRLQRENREKELAEKNTEIEQLKEQVFLLEQENKSLKKSSCAG